MIKSAKILTLVFHSIIVIVGGHGMGILILFDVFIFSEIFNNGFEMTLGWDGFLIIALTSIFGKISLIISLFLQKTFANIMVTILGLFFLVVSMAIIVIRSWNEDGFYMISLLSSIPFLMYVGRVVYLLFKEKKWN